MTHHPPAPSPKRTRTWLDVPYGDKDQAKAVGARWDPAAKRWYDPRPLRSGEPRPDLTRWAALPDIPDLLPGEDRTLGSGLYVDLVPESCWFTNVRTCVSQRDWERLRRMITRRADHRCEICGRPEDSDSRRWLEAHERWTYDEATGVQALRRLICLCSDCHLVTHYGHARVTGREAQAFAHLRTVTGMTEDQADQHIDDAMRRWKARSNRAWALDLSILSGIGIGPTRPT